MIMNMTAIIICGIICLTLIILCAIPKREPREIKETKPEKPSEPMMSYDAKMMNDLHKCCMAYEEELKKRMSPEEFAEMSTRIAKKMFFDEVMEMSEGDFKETILNHFDEITGSQDDFDAFLGGDGDERL